MAVVEAGSTPLSTASLLGHGSGVRNPEPASVLSAATAPSVAKMASHAIFQYNVLTIDDIHNTWTNMIVKMTILRLLGSSDDK